MRNSYSNVAGKVLTVGLMISALAGCDQAEQSQQNIVFMDMAKVLNTSDIGKQESARQKKVHDILIQAEKSAEARYSSMSTEQIQKSRTADTMLLNGQWMAEQRHAREASLKAIAAAVEAYRVNHKITLVLDQSQVIAIDKRADISQDIINQLRGVKVNYGALPEVSLKKETEKSKSSVPAGDIKK